MGRQSEGKDELTPAGEGDGPKNIQENLLHVDTGRGKAWAVLYSR